MQIHLVRHGRSAHLHDGSWFRWSNVSDYEDAYDAVEILEDDRPIGELERLVSGATLVAASDLPRAIASAQRLAPGRTVEISPLLRQIPRRPHAQSHTGRQATPPGYLDAVAVVAIPILLNRACKSVVRT